LRPQLEAAYQAQTRDAEKDALRLLLADARDGHGDVRDRLRRDVPWTDGPQIPVRLGLAGDGVVVTASAVPEQAPVGSLVSAIDGVPAMQRFRSALKLVSGSPQWKTVKAFVQITKCAKGPTMKIVLDAGRGPHEYALECRATEPNTFPPSPPADNRPKPIAELSPSLWYVDLTRASMADLTPKLDSLATARAVLFDMRGYPTGDASQMLTHLLDTPETDRWMHVAKVVGPFGQFAGWEDSGWNLTPAAPHFSGKIVFMTDARAISYAEGVMDMSPIGSSEPSSAVQRPERTGMSARFFCREGLLWILLGCA
jgi:hypothetical protein